MNDKLIDAIEGAMTEKWNGTLGEYEAGTSEHIAFAVAPLIDRAYKDGYDTGKMHATTTPTN